MRAPIMSYATYRINYELFHLPYNTLHSNTNTVQYAQRTIRARRSPTYCACCSLFLQCGIFYLQYTHARTPMPSSWILDWALALVPIGNPNPSLTPAPQCSTASLIPAV